MLALQRVTKENVALKYGSDVLVGYTLEGWDFKSQQGP